MYQVIEPQTEDDFERYYLFRWQQLREPFGLPTGSEKDEYDQSGHHRMIVDRHNQLIAVGRLYHSSPDEALIRYMAVAEEYRGKGVGSSMVSALEDVARERGVKRVMINARLGAVSFYQKNGYHPVGEGPTHFGKIKHQQMQKEIAPRSFNPKYDQWCNELIHLWQVQVPLSVQMGVRIDDYTGELLRVSAPGDLHVNHLGGMFAGSLYALGCLSGWGLLNLMLKERNIDADITLASGEIRYLYCVSGDVAAEANRKDIQGSIWSLIRDKKVVLTVPVTLYSASSLAAEFIGKFMLTPKSAEQSLVNEPPH